MRNKTLIFVGFIMFLSFICESSNAAILFGRVTDQSKHAIAGATVVLVKAADVKRINSLSPVEDLALEAFKKGYAETLTNTNGNYKFGKVPNGKFFPFVIPAKDDTIHLPGGNKSRISIAVKKSERLNIEITT